MSDQILYSVSSKTEGLDQPFLKKEMVYVNDNSAGGVYNGQIIIETSAIANSGRWASYSEGYLIIPYVVAWKTTGADYSALQSPYLTSLKSGSWHIIHSLSVDYNSSNVVQLTPYTNFYCSYRAMTSWSSDDLVKYGLAVNFWPDSGRSVRYQSTPAADINGQWGAGFSNNSIVGSNFEVLSVNSLTAALKTTINATAYNEGLRKRVLCNQISRDLINQNYNQANFMTTSQLNSLSTLPVYSNDAVGGANNLYYINFTAKIRLKDLHDFFDKMPLLKGSYLKFIINYNAGSFQETWSVQAAAGTTPAYSRRIITGSPTIQYGASLPYICTSSAVSGNSVAAGGAVVLSTNPADGLTAGTLNWGSGVNRVSVGGSTSPSVSIANCRLYVPLYTMSPEYEKNYVSMSPTKEIVYKDIYNYTFEATSGNTFNQLLTNGISSPKALVIIPMVSGRSFGAADNTNVYHTCTYAIPPYQSPYATEPATTSPYASITNLNIQVSGVNIFSQNEVFDFSNFMDELSHINSVNGGQTIGLSSGLISEFDFNSIYRYYVVDLSRGYKADDYVPKSVLITGQVGTSKNLELFCFIEYERKLVVDVLAGNVIQM